ncbi:serine carboxypeptidase-like [Musa troglodytarum]|uniref:Carboxypeptidase n=1 Tax=Musa troglodytarum TaxID=320322 RepID=A0A9E7IDB2_9LILI|nr:serine carboxypeptidase-like [Musa troglodytarum]
MRSSFTMGRSQPVSVPLLFLPLLLCSSSLSFGFVSAAGTADGSEEWGYVQVRPKAHLFWWLYRSPQRIDTGSSPWPTLLWLQGGPGGSGVGIRNFQEIGPLDTDLRHRNSTWLQKADLLFVDNPVGTGYSFVEDESLFVRTDWEAATDLTTLLKKLYDEDESRQRSPLFIVAESYGGKFAVTAGLSILKAIEAGELKLKLGGSQSSFLLSGLCRRVQFLTCLMLASRPCSGKQLDFAGRFCGKCSLLSSTSCRYNSDAKAMICSACSSLGGLCFKMSRGLTSKTQ